MKKFSSVIMGVTLLLSALSVPVAVGETKGVSSPVNGETSITEATYGDELDQYMDNCSGVGIFVGTIPLLANTSIMVAQSFIPTKAALTRVELFIGKNATASYPYRVAIRDELTAGNLAETSVNPGDIPTTNYSWIEFNFPDIPVTVGKTYYIVSYTENVTDNWYAWGCNNDSASYPNGCAWVSLDNGNSWSNDSSALLPRRKETKPHEGSAPLQDDPDTCDMCFKTYGTSKTTLQITVIPSFFGPTFIIKNIGILTAINVNWTITVNGGILRLINSTETGNFPELPPNGTLEIKTKLLLGFGPVVITAKAHADNADEVSIEIKGFLLLIFFFYFG